MSEKNTNHTTEDIFGGARLNVTGIDPILDGVEAAGRTGIKVLPAVMPLALVLSGCAGKEGAGVDPQVIGAVGGVILAVEEAYEESDKKFLIRTRDIVAKGLAGYVGGYALAHNAQDGSSWVEGDKLNQTLALAAAAMIAFEKTSLQAFFARLHGKVKEGGASFNENRKVSNATKDLEILIKTAHDIHSNSRSKYTTALMAAATLRNKYGFNTCDAIQNGRATRVSDRQVDLLDKMYDGLGPDLQLDQEEVKKILAMRDQANNQGGK